MILAWLWVSVSLIGAFASFLVYLESQNFLDILRSKNPELVDAYTREAVRDKLILVAQIANLIVGISALFGAALVGGNFLLRLLFQTTVILGLFAVPLILTAISLTNWIMRRKYPRK